MLVRDRRRMVRVELAEAEPVELALFPAEAIVPCIRQLRLPSIIDFVLGGGVLLDGCLRGRAAMGSSSSIYRHVGIVASEGVRLCRL